jgi:hypothetical protein
VVGLALKLGCCVVDQDVLLVVALSIPRHILPIGILGHLAKRCPFAGRR